MTDSAKLPLDYRLEHEQLQQRQALAQALMQRALTPAQGQMIGPHYASAGPVASIGAPIVSALLARGAMDRNRTDARELAERFKGVQNRMTPKEIMSIPGASLDSRRQAAMAGDGQGDLSLLSPDQREHVVNGQIVTTTPGAKPAIAMDARDRFNPVGPIGTGENGTPIYGQTEKETGKAAFAPKGVAVNVNTTQKAGDKFATELAGKRADILTKSYDNAIAAKKAYEAMSEATHDLEAGIKSGITANINLGLAKIGKSLGLSDDPTIASTEAYRSNMARETLNLVKNLGAGTGISNADREFAEKAAGGDITLDDRTMLRLLNVAAAASGNVLVEHQRLLQSNADASGALPQDLETFNVPWQIKANNSGGGLSFDERGRRFTANTPPEGTGGQGGAISLDQYLKSKGAGNARR